MSHDDQHDLIREISDALAQDGHATIVVCTCGLVIFSIQGSHCTLSDAIARIALMRDGIDFMVDSLSREHDVPSDGIHIEIDRMLENLRKSHRKGTFTRIEKQD